MVNMYLHSVSRDAVGLLAAGIGEQQAKIFRDEFLHLADRVVAYIRDHCNSLSPRYVALDSAAQAVTRRRQMTRLTTHAAEALLQVLAGAPCLICGHELQKRLPSGHTLDLQPKLGMWVHLRNVFKGPDRETQESALHRVAKWLQSLGVSQPALSAS